VPLVLTKGQPTTVRGKVDANLETIFKKEKKEKAREK